MAAHSSEGQTINTKLFYMIFLAIRIKYMFHEHHSHSKIKKLFGSINKWHLAYTALLFFNNFAYGISVTIVNSTMLDIGHILGVNIDTMSYVAIAISVGYQLGALASLLYGRLNRQLVLSGAVLLMAAATSLLPHYRRLALALPMMVLNGVGQRLLGQLGARLAGGDGPANMFFSGVGSIVAPLMVASRVHGNANHTEEGDEVTVGRRIADLTLPFAVEGVLQSLVPLVLLATFFFHRYTPTPKDASGPPSKSSFEEIASSSCSKTTTQRRRKTKLALLAVSASLSMAAEMGYAIFSSALWQQLEVLTAPEAVSALAVFTSAYTASRLLTAAISLWLRPDTILSYHYALIVGSLLFLFLGRHSHGLILAGNALLGASFAPMWPAMFAFTERHLTLSDRVCSTFAFLSGALTLVMPNVLARLFTDFPLVIFLVEGVFVLTSLLLFVVVRLLMRNDER
ncbi:hypothetical protein TYRP_009162 [Tyrophagus putrescentiae]|nr:hypothetical protein TYRP_009162 [Tyrophagus putrescentiae]